MVRTLEVAKKWFVAVLLSIPVLLSVHDVVFIAWHFIWMRTPKSVREIIDSRVVTTLNITTSIVSKTMDGDACPF